MSDSDLHVRSATAGDREWILRLAPRLHDFGPPPFRPREGMDRAVVASIAGALDGATPGAEVYVAEGPAGERLGFVHLHGATDFFTGEAHGHVSDIVVAPEAEGRGVGQALMGAADAWARERGYRLLSLHVFDGNARARRFYAQLGYRPDIVKLIKPVDPVITPAAPADHAAVTALLDAAGLPHQDVTAELLAHFLLARSAQALVGVVGVEPLGDVGLLRSAAVAAGHRGRGLGVALTRAAERHARELGVHRLYLLTTTAEAFFAKLGYRVIPREDAPAAIRGTTAYGELCASTSACMVRDLE